MNKKDITFTKKMVSNPDNSAITKIATCYVNVSNDHEVAIQEPEPFLLIEEDEAELYCSFLKKAMNAKMDKNAFLADDNRKWAQRLIDTGLTDKSLLTEICTEISENYPSNENYSIMFALCSFPQKPNETFPVLIVMIQPCKLDKPGLVYDYKGCQFAARKKELALDVPTQAFMYPAISDFTPDYNHVLCVSKNTKLVTALRAFNESLFGCVMKPSVEEQKQAFRNIIASGFDTGKATYECVKDVVDYINELTEENALSGEDKSFTPNDLADMIINSGCVEKEKAEDMKNASKEAGMIELNPELMIDKSVSIETDTATVKVDKLGLDQIKIRVIDGEECFIIPARNAVIAGIEVKG